MGISPRSRWSNRDDSSYRRQRGPPSSPKRGQIHKWSQIRGDAAAPFLLIGQMASLATLILLYLGVNTVDEGLNGNGATDDGAAEELADNEGFQWGMGATALAVTFGFGMASCLALFRVIISRHSPRRRKRMARIWLIALIIAVYGIAFT